MAFTAGQSYVAPAGGSFVSVVNGVSNAFGTQAEAEADYNTRTGQTPAAGAVKPAGSVDLSGYELQDPTAINASLAAIQNAYNQSLLKQGDRRLALDAAYQQAQVALGGLQQLAQMRGPRNAFQQQAVEHGLDQNGIAQSINAIAGRHTLPRFGMNQAPPQALTPDTQAQDVAIAGGYSGATNPLNDVTNSLLGQMGLGAATQPKGVPGFATGQAVP